MLRCTTDRRRAARSSSGREKFVQIGRKTAHVGIQYGSQVQTPHEKVVPHVILSGNALRRAKVGGKRKVRRSRDVAADGGVGQVSQRNAPSDDSDSTDKSAR